jgi:hypothetical protein
MLTDVGTGRKALLDVRETRTAAAAAQLNATVSVGWPPMEAEVGS